ncbi:MAG: hypothetical protein HYU69_01705 [Bacteroidetes bacterium]|nr:hypothetical protein [Bacteroidota bacterium]
MRKGLINIIPGFILMMLLIQCKKDSDIVPPVVKILSPYENQIFSVYDIFTIKADISDDKQLTSVNIKLLNEQQAIMQVPVTFTASGKKLALDRKYELYDIHLPTGYYYLRIEATDGVNSGVGYLKIFIHEAPTFRTGIYAITRSSSLLNIVKIDSSFNALNKLSYTSDYAGSGISSYYRCLYVSGNYTGAIKGIDLESNTVKWLVDPVISGDPCFTSLYNKGDRNYVSYYSGFVKAYDHYGISTYETLPVPAGFYPIKVVENGSHVLVEVKDKSGPTKKLVTYLSATGLGIQEIYMYRDVVDYLMKNSNEVFVFSNNSGQGTMEVYDIANNSFFSPHALNTGKIWSAVQIDADNYLIGHDDGIIYRYQYSQNSLTTLVSGVKAYRMRYDVVNNQLIVAQAKDVKLYTYSPSVTTLDNTVALADSILDIHILFNK